jgi:repressor LexA
MTLSQRQEKILNFVRDFVREQHFPPTIREIGENVGISSTSVVNYNLDALEKKGHITRGRNVSRGLRLVEPEEAVPMRAPNVIQIPLVGRIAAGEPLPIPDETVDFAVFGDETVDVAAGMLNSRDDLYALHVRGQSMIDALVNDGDVVVMKHQNHAENGDMVAARLRQENETTLKRFYLEGDRVRLQPANPTMQPIYVPAEDVEVQGKVVMVIRQLD